MKNKLSLSCFEGWHWQPLPWSRVCIRQLDGWPARTIYKTTQPLDQHSQVLRPNHYTTRTQYRPRVPSTNVQSLPEVFQDNFEINRPPNTFHCHHTRSTSNLHIFRVNTGFGKRALCYKTASMWNDLPAKFKCLKSTTLFKRKIKMYLAHHS